MRAALSPLLQRDWPLLLLITAVVIGAGWLVSGLIVAPRASWATELTMPPFLLPAPVDGVASLGLSLAFSIVGWRIWLLSPRPQTDMSIWATVLILSWLFTPAFLVYRAVQLAMGIVIVMALLMIALPISLMRFDRLSALLAVPCTAYVVYVVALSWWVITSNHL